MATFTLNQFFPLSRCSNYRESNPKEWIYLQKRCVNLSRCQVPDSNTNAGDLFYLAVCLQYLKCHVLDTKSGTTVETFVWKRMHIVDQRIQQVNTSITLPLFTKTFSLKNLKTKDLCDHPVKWYLESMLPAEAWWSFPHDRENPHKDDWWMSVRNMEPVQEDTCERSHWIGCAQSGSYRTESDVCWSGGLCLKNLIPDVCVKMSSHKILYSLTIFCHIYHWPCAQLMYSISLACQRTPQKWKSAPFAWR